MKRIHLIEISDEPWCPATIRHAVTDYCRFVEELSGVFNPLAPALADGLQQTGARRIVDLASGAAGPWLKLLPVLREMGVGPPVCLTDYFPNTVALERARRLSDQAISYHPEPVDAAHVPAELSGFRTIFSAFHHFRPEEARAVLADAVAKGQGIGVFECADRRIVSLLAVLGTPIRVLLLVPFIRPFRWSTLFWTYLVPALPLILLFDSIVSCLRVYDAEELRALTAGLDGYLWEIGTVRGRIWLIRISYLIGVPR